MTFFNPGLAQRLAMVVLSAAIVYPANRLDAPMGGGESYVLYFSWWEILHGLAFGALVMAPFVSVRDLRLARVIGLAIASVIIYHVAIESPDLLVADAGDLIRFVISGVIGASLVAIATKFIAPLDVRISYWALAVLAGAAGGFVFNYTVGICEWDTCDSVFDVVLFTSGWFVWQALVCLALYFGQASPASDSEP